MQFSSKSTSNQLPLNSSIYSDLQNNFNLLLTHQYHLMGILYKSSGGTPYSYPQAIGVYNQKTTDSYILVNNEDCSMQAPPSLTAPSSDSSEVAPAAQEINATQYNQQSSKKIKTAKGKVEVSESKKKRKKFESEEEYAPNEDQAFDCSQPKTSQSKNIPKIYGKGILNFISRNKRYTERVLAHFGCDSSEFEASLEYFNKHVSSIADLRSMWINSDSNKFAKVYRVMSKEYIRKHSLSYIFNSRVTSIVKHIKYRHTLQRSIEAPQTFTRMKEY